MAPERRNHDQLNWKKTRFYFHQSVDRRNPISDCRKARRVIGWLGGWFEGEEAETEIDHKIVIVDGSYFTHERLLDVVQEDFTEVENYELHDFEWLLETLKPHYAVKFGRSPITEADEQHMIDYLIEVTNSPRGRKSVVLWEKLYEPVVRLRHSWAQFHTPKSLKDYYEHHSERIDGGADAILWGRSASNSPLRPEEREEPGVAGPSRRRRTRSKQSSPYVREDGALPLPGSPPRRIRTWVRTKRVDPDETGSESQDLPIEPMEPNTPAAPNQRLSHLEHDTRPRSGAQNRASVERSPPIQNLPNRDDFAALPPLRLDRSQNASETPESSLNPTVRRQTRRLVFRSVVIPAIGQQTHVPSRKTSDPPRTNGEALEQQSVERLLEDGDGVSGETLHPSFPSMSTTGIHAGLSTSLMVNVPESPVRNLSAASLFAQSRYATPNVRNQDIYWDLEPVPSIPAPSSRSLLSRARPPPSAPTPLSYSASQQRSPLMEVDNADETSFESIATAVNDITRLDRKAKGLRQLLNIPSPQLDSPLRLSPIDYVPGQTLSPRFTPAFESTSSQDPVPNSPYDGRLTFRPRVDADEAAHAENSVSALHNSRLSDSGRPPQPVLAGIQTYTQLGLDLSGQERLLALSERYSASVDEMLVTYESCAGDLDIVEEVLRDNEAFFREEFDV